MKKQLMALILIIATFLCFATVSAADTQKEISLYVNGEKIHSEVPPQIINGTTLVPLRVIFEALGASVEWDNSTKTVSSTLGEESIKLTIGESNLYKNGNVISLPVPAQIIDGRTLVPARAISEAYGFIVKWYSEIRTVSINKINNIDYTPYYNLSGEEVMIDKALAAEYRAIGWNLDKNKIAMVKMYAADGRILEVPVAKVDEYKNVGWYTEAFVKMYAIDGRTINVQPSQVEAHKQVGWSTEKPKIFPTSVVMNNSLNLVKGSTHTLTYYFTPSNVTEKKLVWFTSDSNVATVNQSGVITAKKQGIATITAKTANGLTASCNINVTDTKYDDSKVGSVTGLVTWQYNKYIGTKPDVGANVLLVQTNHRPTNDDSYTFFLYSNIGNQDELVYVTEVDGNGNFYFDNIPAGEYFLLVESKNTHPSTTMGDAVANLARSMLKGVISQDALEKLCTRIKVYNFEIKRITIRENQTVRYSKDWGYTYW